jgi:hypothetical protein
MKTTAFLFAACLVAGCRTHPGTDLLAGGEGSTRERAIVLRPPNIDTGFLARLDWRCKVSFPGWREITNEYECVDSRVYYSVVVTRHGQTNRVWFDCTAFDSKE